MTVLPINSMLTTLSTQGLYNRTVAVHRMAAPATGTIGNTGYFGPTQSAETTLFTGLPAFIQIASAGSRTSTKGGALPGDAVTKPTWTILIPATSIAQYSIRDRDIIVDDEGYRYEVGSNMWTPLGYQLMTVRQEA